MTETQAKPRRWEPLLIALFLAVLLAADGDDMIGLLRGTLTLTGRARGVLELGAALVMLGGLVMALIKPAAADDTTGE